MEADSSFVTARSSSSVPASSTTVSVPGATTSTAATRPRTRSRNGSTTSPPSTSGVIIRPLSVPQSTSVTTRSCATSTRRRVR